MLELYKGVKTRVVLASGALGFDGRGYFWERFLMLLGLLRFDYSLFVPTLKTLTLEAVKGNLVMWAPWRCVRFVTRDGEDVTWKPWRWHEAVTLNAVGLTNPGFDYWYQYIAPKVLKSGINVIVSIMPKTLEECRYMVEKLNELAHLNILGIEINVSCPNTKELPTGDRQRIVEMLLYAISHSSRPVIVKIGHGAAYLDILRDIASTDVIVSYINTVPWATIFPDKVSPLAARLKVNGGLSGSVIIPYRNETDDAIKREFPKLRRIMGGGISDYETLWEAQTREPDAVSLGSVMLKNPRRAARLIAATVNPVRFIGVVRHQQQ